LASKGDKGYLEPQAQRLYADGNSLSSISEQLGVSTTSLSRWKADSKDPHQDMDEWDRARSQKRGNTQRLRDLFEEQLENLENTPASQRTAPMMDTLSKLGALLERWDKTEKAQRVADDVVKEVTKAGLTAETAAEIRRQILGINA
jgi:cell division septum initiation protein DivIVA